MKQVFVLTVLMTVTSAALLSGCAMQTRRGSSSQNEKIPATPSKVAVDPNAASQAALRDFAKASAVTKARDWRQAVNRWQKFLADHSDSPLVPDAQFELAQAHLQLGDQAAALRSFDLIVRGRFASGKEGEAALQASRLARGLGQIDVALGYIGWAQREQKLNQTQNIQARWLRFEILANEKRLFEALKQGVEIMQSSQNPSDQERARSASIDLINSGLSEAELENIMQDRGMAELRAHAAFRLGRARMDRRDLSGARSALEVVMQASPASELAERASHLIKQIDARSRVDARTIGAILPLTGDQAGKGQRILRGLQLGLGLTGRPWSDFRISVIDSEANADVARRGVERLVVEDNAIALVGGFLTRTATAEAAKAQELGLPAILLSQKSGLTSAGEFVFRNALSSQLIVDALLDHAMGRLGLKRFAVLFPNDPYGIEYTNVFWDSVRARGGEITAAQPYDPKETDFRSHVQRLVGTFYIEDRAIEYRQRLAARKPERPNLRRDNRDRQTDPQDVLPPILSFEALFIPDSPRAVGQIAPMLAYNDVTGVRLLGTNIWNTPQLVARAQRFVENALFVDALPPSERPQFRGDFNTLYRAAFGEDPGLFEAQGFEAGLALRQALASGETTRVGLQQRLATLQAIQGPLGPLTMSPDRELRRRLTALTVIQGQIQPEVDFPAQ